jgi:hypothetical protein
MMEIIMMSITAKLADYCCADKTKINSYFRIKRAGAIFYQLETIAHFMQDTFRHMFRQEFLSSHKLS